MPGDDPKLTREAIQAALDALDAILQGKGVMGELCIFGGDRFPHRGSLAEMEGGAL